MLLRKPHCAMRNCKALQKGAVIHLMDFSNKMLTWLLKRKARRTQRQSIYKVGRVLDGNSSQFHRGHCVLPRLIFHIMVLSITDLVSPATYYYCHNWELRTRLSLRKWWWAIRVKFYSCFLSVLWRKLLWAVGVCKCANALASVICGVWHMIGLQRKF